MLPLDQNGKVEVVNLEDALETRYLAYALSTIMGRALPDVRDGLKPVHRRILHTMRLLRLNPDAAFAKCARIVGDVMGKFHPHGDQAIYDALVRLSQEFAQRYPLVDGQGNFGNVDGDNAAAMRYTEARMTHAATALLEGITEDAVDFKLTYNEEDEEPIVLPGAFPNLLANGSAGIAVGMATNIPPHNVSELCKAALHLIKYPNAGFDKLAEMVKGPDFPTGGVIVEPSRNIVEAYKTGKGGFRIRAKWQKQNTKHGTWQIVVTEIPYQVQKSKLIEKIAELILARKLPQLIDVRDESAEDIRIVLEPRSKNVDPNLLMEQLFKNTDLETRFPLNMNVLVDGKIPKVLSLRDCINEWLKHRKVVLVRRCKNRLEHIKNRIEILEGYLIVYLNLDEVIKIVRNEDNPKQKLIKKFDLTDVQAEAILNLRLRALRKLEEIEIKNEHKKLKAEKKDIEAILKDEKKQWAAVGEQVKSIKKQFDANTEIGKRRSTFEEAPEVDLEAFEQSMIEKEPITVVVSQKGWIRAMRGHIEDLKSLSFKEGDRLQIAFFAETTDQIMLFGTNGRFYTLNADKLPGGRGHGEPVRLIVDMGNDAEVVSAFVYQKGKKRLVVSKKGNGFIVAEDEVVANTKKGKQVLNAKMPDEAEVCVEADDEADLVAVVGDNKKMLIFPREQIPEMTRGKGVRLQKYSSGGVKDAKMFKKEDGLTWGAARTTQTSMKQLKDYVGERAQAGRKVPKGFPTSGRFG